MGLDLRRSDTPVFMQEFLSELLLMVLTDKPVEDVLERITVFRKEFSERPGWEKGSPKRANNITEYQAKEAKAGKANMPGHVRASINWNTLKRMMGDKYSMGITDGAKVIVCKIKDNPMGFTSVAYPVDELRLPQWFKDLPFDDSAMETAIINNKLDNLIGVLEWDLESTTQNNNFGSLFSPTYIHYIEHKFQDNIHYRYFKKFNGKIKTSSNSKKSIELRFMVRARNIKEPLYDLKKIRNELIVEGILKSYIFEKSLKYDVTDARDFSDYAISKMKKDKMYFLTKKSKAFLLNALKKKQSIT